MANAIAMKTDVTLKYQSNLGEEVEEVELSAGDQLAVLQEWENAWLAKDTNGHLLNVKKELADPV